VPTRALSIVLASNNRGKLAEFIELLRPYRVSLYPLARFTQTSVDETGSTFRDNALLKARYAARLAEMPAIADDSGLEVDAIGGAPGVYSARYAGAGATDQANNEKLLAALSDVPDELRGARFRCLLAYVRSADDPKPVLAEGFWPGRVARSVRGSEGFGYDSLFLPSGGSLTAAELSREEKNAGSHRARALKALVETLVRHGELAP